VAAVNLFSCGANPITNDHVNAEHLILPEGGNRKHYQIYSIDSVVGYQQGSAVQRDYHPFGMLDQNSNQSLTYRTSMREAIVGRGSEVYLATTYPQGELPQLETLSIHLTCTNRSLPEGLKLGDVSQPTTTSPDRLSFRNIRPISPALNPPTGEGLLWRLVGHVSLNFLSITTAENLRALLNLYIFSDRQEQGQEVANRRRIDSIQKVTSTVETRLVGRGSVLRGQLINISCRLDHFAGIGDLYLFGCVLEYFLSNYAGINSYTRVEIDDVITGAVFKWPPRLGTQPVL
jgi:type VI secretion system protein ImpG